MPKRQPNTEQHGQQSVATAFAWLAHYPPDVDWHAELQPRALCEIFDEAVERFADNVCTDYFGRRMTYAEIGALTARVAAGLHDIGVERGTRVGLLLPNCPDFIIFYLAVLKRGGVIVNYNPLYTVEEIEHQVRDSGTELMITLDLRMLFDKATAVLDSGSIRRLVVCPFVDRLPTFKRLLFRIFRRRELARPMPDDTTRPIVRLADLIQRSASHPPPAVEPGDLAVLQYTGGTTGTPKGAMLTHANLTVNLQQVSLWFADAREGEERALAILPFFHVFAMTGVMNYGIAHGFELILIPRFDLDEVIRLIRRTRPTVLAGVPTLFNALISHRSATTETLKSLRYCISGGAPLPGDVRRNFERVASCSLVEGYGLSETSPVVTCNPVHGESKDGSIGLPLPGTIVSIRSLDDPAIEMPIGENGEICISGPQVMAGYWNKDDETADAFVDSFFRTGDVGYMDEQGYVFIVDRIKDLIIASGFNVYPRRIEEAIQDHPDVVEVTVIGIPDDYRGEAPKAFVRLKEGAHLSVDELLAFLAPKLSKIEMPASIEFRDELPRTLIGKLSKKELRKETIQES